MFRPLMAALLVAPWTLCAQAATTFTGDKIQSLPVITQLDVDDLAPGRTQRFMFQGAERRVLVCARYRRERSKARKADLAGVGCARRRA
jgi:hypothetical protein